MTRKISRVSGPPDQPTTHDFEYHNTYVRERCTDGTERLRIGLRGGYTAVLPILGLALAPPYRVLYILHTTRTSSPLGRYESDDLEPGELSRMLTRFASYFAEDARHDVWVHSMPDNGTIVLDRYNMAYAYGPLERLEHVLKEGGIVEAATWAGPEVPYPHALHYHPEWDDSERALLTEFDWTRTPLRSDDVQTWSGPQPAN